MKGRGFDASSTSWKYHTDPGLVKLRAGVHPGPAALRHDQDPSMGTHLRVTQRADHRRQLHQGSVRRRLRHQLLPVHSQRPSVPRPAEEDRLRQLQSRGRPVNRRRHDDEHCGQPLSTPPTARQCSRQTLATNDISEN